MSISRYQLLRHLGICKSFTHRKASQRVTFGEFGEERFHVPVLISKPDFQKQDEPASELAGHMLGMCSSPVPCRELWHTGQLPTLRVCRLGASLPPALTAQCAHWHGTTPAPGPHSRLKRGWGMVQDSVSTGFHYFLASALCFALS